jgi:hypothetical protein
MKLARGLMTAALFLAAACAHPKPAEGSAVVGKAAEFFPLEVGRQWVYSAQLLGESREVTVRILRREGDYFVDSQGGQLRADEQGVRDHQRYLLQNPVRLGHAWTNVVGAASAEHYRIEEAGVPCVVPAGRFDRCVVVEGRTMTGDGQGALVNRMTFAEGVGLVRSEVSLERNGKSTLQSRLLLKTYLGAQGGRTGGNGA